MSTLRPSAARGTITRSSVSTYFVWSIAGLPRRQVLAVALQFGNQGLDALHHDLIRRGWIQVDHLQQQPGALQVTQEPQPQTRAFSRAFDQAGNVGHDETAIHA